MLYLIAETKQTLLFWGKYIFTKTVFLIFLKIPQKLAQFEENKK